MDVRSCGSRDHQPRGTHAQADDRIRKNARSPERAQLSHAFYLTDDLHGWRFSAKPNSFSATSALITHTDQRWTRAFLSLC